MSQRGRTKRVVQRERVLVRRAAWWHVFQGCLLDRVRGLKRESHSFRPKRRSRLSLSARNTHYLCGRESAALGGPQGWKCGRSSAEVA